MKIVFIGTPEISAYYLEFLKKYFSIPLVITQSAKPKGRGLKITRSAVAKRAEALDLELIETSEINQPEIINKIIELQPDVGVVVAFGQLLSNELLRSTKYGFINIHFSLLPQLRGADPVATAIRLGMKKTGASVFRITEELDAGDVYSQKEISISESDTCEIVFNKLMPAGAEAVLTALAMIQSQEKPKPQVGEVSYAPKTTKADYDINFTKSAEAIHNLIRSGIGSKLAWVRYQNTQIKISTAAISEAGSFGLPGEFISKGSLLVQTGEGVIEILEVIPEGKRPMPASDWLRGQRLESGFFGS